MGTGDWKRGSGCRPARRGGTVRRVALALGLAWSGGAAAQVPAPPAPPPAAADTSGLPSPGGAVLRAVAVPGWGQVYAGQPLKAPVALALVGGAVAFAVDRQRQYLLFRRAAFYAGCVGVDPEDRTDGGAACTPEAVEAARDEWEALGEPEYVSAARGIAGSRNQARGQRDVAVLLVGVAYAVQALDAYVAAQLAGFDVSEDLSVRVAPERGGLALRVRL